MATTIKLKNSVTTTNAPSSLVQGEVAINITDKKVWVGNAATTPIQLLGAGASGTFGALTCTSLTNSGLTSGRVTYATTGGLLTDSAGLTFDGTNFATTGTATATRFIPSGSTVATNGMYLPAANSIGISTNSTNAIYIDSSQNVGIGTSSPQGKLDVSSSSAGVTAGDLVVDTANKTVYVGRQSSTSADNSYLIVRGRLNGSGTNQAIVITGDTTAYGTGIFRPNNDNIGFSTLATERMRITSGGELCVNTTSASLFSTTWQTVIKGSNCFAVNNTNTTGATTAAFQASNYTVGGANVINFYNGSGNVAGSISVPTNASTGTTVAYNTSSDYRMKENIAPMIGALNKVLQLNPVTYTWKSNGYAGQGFIAHELQAVVPDCVTGEKDAVDAEGKPVYQGVDTSFLVATLTAAIQEQQAMIVELTNRIKKLEGA